MTQQQTTSDVIRRLQVSLARIETAQMQAIHRDAISQAETTEMTAMPRVTRPLPEARIQPQARTTTYIDTSRTMGPYDLLNVARKHHLHKASRWPSTMLVSIHNALVLSRVAGIAADISLNDSTVVCIGIEGTGE